VTAAFALTATLLSLTGAMRLVELAVSVRRWKSRPDALVAEPALFPAMAGLHAALVALPLLEIVLFDRPFLPPLAAACGMLLAAATALRVWTLRTLGRSWNVRVVVPDRVVTDGPYAFIRHPNYLVVVIELIALPLFHTAWMSAVALGLWNGLVLMRRIATEERALAELPAWRAAFADKARLIPGVF
jgi:methyltransferase